jgi:hypothetical protein
MLFTDETKLRLFENQIRGNIYVQYKKDEGLKF